LAWGEGGKLVNVEKKRIKDEEGRGIIVGTSLKKSCWESTTIQKEGGKGL